MDALWYAFLSSSTGLYEIIPGFICGMIAAVAVTKLDHEPAQEVLDMFEKAQKPVD